MSPEAVWHRLVGADVLAALYGLLAATAGRGILLLAMGGITVLALRRHAAATRHLAWTALMFGLVVLPVLISAIPHITVPLDVLPAASVAPRLPPPPLGTGPLPPGPASTPALDRRGEAPIDAANARAFWSGVVVNERLVYVWLFGFAISVAGMCLSLVRLERIRRTARACHPRILHAQDVLARQLNLTRRVRVLEMDGTLIPITWGILRPTILLPPTAREWPHRRLEAVLLHELAHVRRWDAAGQLLAGCACALHWYNPLVWCAARQLARECEYACDDHVIRRGLTPADYAGELLSLARLLRDQRRAGAIAVVGTGELAARIRALLSPDRCRTPPGPRAMSMGALAGACVLLLAAAAAPSRTPASDPRLATRALGRPFARVGEAGAEEGRAPHASSPSDRARAGGAQLPPGVMLGQGRPVAARADDHSGPVEQAGPPGFVRAEPLVSAVLQAGAPPTSPHLSTEALPLAAGATRTPLGLGTPGFDGLPAEPQLSADEPRQSAASGDAEVQRWTPRERGGEGRRSLSHHGVPVENRLSTDELASRLGSSPDAELRRRAAWALRGRGGNGPRSLSRAVLHDEAGEVREMAAWALAGVGGAEALVQAARGDGDPSVRFTAFWALEQQGPAVAEPAISAATRDPLLALRRRAVWYAGARRLRASVPDLLAALSDEDSQVRKAAAWALGNVRARGITPAVRRLLDDPDTDVRRAALWALLRSGDADARATIREARSSNSPAVQRSAARAESGQWRSWDWEWSMPRPRTQP